MSIVDGRVAITAADVQLALDETDPQAVWLLNEDGSTFTAWIPDVSYFRPPNWPLYLTTCEALRRGVARDGIDKAADIFDKVLKRQKLHLDRTGRVSRMPGSPLPERSPRAA